LYSSLVDKFIGNVHLDVAGTYLTVSNWLAPSDGVHWMCKVQFSGTFQVTLLSASPGKRRIGKLSTQGQSIFLHIPQTANSSDFVSVTGGTITLSAGDIVEFHFQLNSNQRGKLACSKNKLRQDLLCSKLQVQ